MINTSRSSPTRNIWMVVAAFSTFCAQDISAQSITKPDLCEHAARSARKTYEIFRATEKERPDVKRDVVAEGIQQAIYQNFQQAIQKSNNKLESSVAELDRLWRDRAVKDYLTNPELNPVTYERSSYLLCMGQSQ